MTNSEFLIHWQRLVAKFPEQFTTEEQQDRTYAEWFGQFRSFDNARFGIALDYWLKSLNRGKFPFPSVITNCYNLPHGKEKIHLDERRKQRAYQKGYPCKRAEGNHWNTTDKPTIDTQLETEEHEIAEFAKKNSLPYPSKSMEDAEKWAAHARPGSMLRNMENRPAVRNQDLIDSLNATEEHHGFS